MGGIMKKLFLKILVLSLLFSGSAYASKIGKGQIQLSDEVTESFIKFLRNEYGAFFVVNPDGTHAVYGVCGAKQCKGGMLQVLKWCKEDTGQKCHVFAQRKNNTSCSMQLAYDNPINTIYNKCSLVS